MTIAKDSKLQRHLITRQLWKEALLVIFISLIFSPSIEVRAQDASLIAHDFSSQISLSEFPKISREALAAQNNIIIINEPIPCDQAKSIGEFEIEILSEKNFKDTRLFSFVGDAESLKSFISEVNYINSGVSLSDPIYASVKNEVDKLVADIFKQLVFKDPQDFYAFYRWGLKFGPICGPVFIDPYYINDLKTLKATQENIEAIKQLGKHLRDSSSNDLLEDIKAIADAILVDAASKMAEKKS
jgi:hypothetical protein